MEIEHRVEPGRRSATGTRDHPHRRLAVLILWIGAAVWTARILWEETVLTWRRGPQMIGFSFGHGAGVWFLLCWIGAHVFLVILLIRILWSRRSESHHRKRLTLLGVWFLPVVVPLWIPEVAYLRLSFALWGPGPHAGSHLVAAAAAGDLSLLKYLVSKGTSIDSEISSGTSALNAAAAGGRTVVVEYLLKKGADPNHRGGPFRRTPLMHAVEMNRVEAVRALLRGGADPTLQDEKRESALDIAVRLQHAEIIEILRAAGKTQNAVPGPSSR